MGIQQGYVMTQLVLLEETQNGWSLDWGELCYDPLLSYWTWISFQVQNPLTEESLIIKYAKHFRNWENKFLSDADINNLKNHHGLPIGMMAYGVLIKVLLTVNLLDLLIHPAVIFIISK